MKKMSYTTFNSHLSETDINYPKYQFGRVIFEYSNPNPIFEVYDIKWNKLQVNGFNIKIEKPFDKKYKHGRVTLNKSRNRICIILSPYCTEENNNNNNRVTTLLSRYNYQIHKGVISDDFEVDHKDGNRLNDNILNLNAITPKHNIQKSKYAYYWLPQFNIENNTNYTESDLLNEEILKDVINFSNPQRRVNKKISRAKSYKNNIIHYKQYNNEYKEKNYEKIQQMYKDYYNKNKEPLLEYNKDYREKNKDNISLQRKQVYEINKDELKNKANEYYHSNIETIKEKRKQYRQENHETIQERKTLYQRLGILSKKEWTKEVGERYIYTLNKIFNYYNVTLDDISKGLDISKFNIATIKSLNKLRLLYSEQTNKLND